MTIVRGKGSLPFWIQIPTTLLYLGMCILIKIYGDDKRYQLLFNKVIPYFVMGLMFPNMAMTNMNAYESEVIWAFCLCTIFTIFQIFSLLYGLEFK
jgi:hypothetical protein